MDAKSLSSASKSAASAAKSASSAVKSGTSQAANAASQASASLASGSAKASSYADNVGGTTATTKTAGIFAVSNFTLTSIAILIGAAYYYGYLDGLIEYVQNLMNQAQDQKERVLKENTGQTSLKAAAKDKYDEATVKTEDMTNQLHAEAQRQQTGTAQPSEGAPLISSASH